MTKCWAYLGARWRGTAPLNEVFWTDMVLIGTAVNLATTLAAMFLISIDASMAIAVATFFAPLPLNIFLVVAVWRSAVSASPTVALAARVVSVLWFLTATTL